MPSNGSTEINYHQCRCYSSFSSTFSTFLSHLAMKNSLIKIFTNISSRISKNSEKAWSSDQEANTDPNSKNSTNSSFAWHLLWQIFRKSSLKRRSFTVRKNFQAVNHRTMTTTVSEKFTSQNGQPNKRNFRII